MKKGKAFFYHLLIEFKSGFRNRSVFFINYFLPLFFYIMMGFMMGKINIHFKEYMKISMILFAIMTSTLLTVPTEVTGARVEGVMRSYKVYGIGRGEILLHYTLNSLFHCVVTSLIIYFTSTPVFDAQNIKSMLPVMAAILLFFIGCMGICLALSMVFQVPKVSGLIAQAVFIPSILAGGIMIPMDAMPKELINVSKILPSTHVMNIMELSNRSGASSINMSIAGSVIVLCVIIIVTYGFSFFKFNYNNK